jgi:hypothetical protein
VVGVDVYEADVDKADPIHSTEPRRNVKYQLQFSRFKDMILSSGEERDQGGRRGLWMDLLKEFLNAYSISKTFINSSSHPSAPSLPDFVAMNLVHSRAVFRSSGHYSKSLLLSIAYAGDNQTAQRIINSFLQRKPQVTHQPHQPSSTIVMKKESAQAFPAVFSTNKEAPSDNAETDRSSPTIIKLAKTSLDEWRHSSLGLLVVFSCFLLSPKSNTYQQQELEVYALSIPMVFMCASLLFLLRVAEKRFQKVA